MADKPISELKTCTKCREAKPRTEFCSDRSRSDGLAYRCRACSREAAATYRDANADRERARSKSYREENYEKEVARKADYRSRTVERRAAYNANWNRENAERKRATSAAWRAQRPGYSSAATKRWRESKPDRAREVQRLASAKRRASIKGKLENAIMSGVRNSILLGSKAGRHTFDLLGYTAEDLKTHLEQHFQPGMSWSNYGKRGWHIDHRIPLAAFNYETPDHLDFRRAWALSNLQPMWGVENMSKGAKLSEPFQPSLQL